MNLLAIDTATEQFSVALAADSNTAAPAAWLFEADAGLRHSEMVMDIIDMLLDKAALKPQDLSGVVCMGGPGSFTGLRIGFAIAKGLALSLGIPFAAIPTLDCLAWPFSAWPGIVVPAIDAKKGAFFCALYRGGKRLCPDMDAPPDEIARAISAAPSPGPILLTGPAAPMLYEKIYMYEKVYNPETKLDINPGKGLRWGNAQTLLHIARETNCITQCNTDPSCGPVYIRKSDAEIRNESTNGTN
jgi:tRNA threonylcarbamoyladenosine biosynthesis protein TsaB